jgi:hypothetical protein
MQIRHGFFSLLVVASLIAGCMPSKVLLVPDAETYTVVPAGQGVVAFQLIDTDSGIPLEYLTIAPKDVNEADENKFIQIEVLKVSDGGAHTYVGVVPAGQYSINQFMGTMVQGQLIFRRTVPSDPSFGTFAVQPGMMTNLGTALYYAKPNGPLYEHVLVRHGDFGEAAELVRRDFSELSGSIANIDSPIRWDEDGYADERFNQYLNVVQNPLSLGRWQLLGEELVVLSQAGAMLRASSSGEWAQDFVETDFPLLMIDRNAGGEELVCAEGAYLFHKSSADAEWQALQLPENANLIAARIDDGGNIHIVDRKQTALTVYERPAGEQSSWSATMVYRQKSAWVSPQQDRANQEAIAAAAAGKEPVKQRRTPGELEGVSAAIIEDKLVVIEDGVTWSIDAATRQASKVKTPKKFIRVVDTGNGVLGSWESSIVDDGLDRYHWAPALSGPWQPIKYEYDRCPGEAVRAGRDIVCADEKTRKYTSVRFFDEPMIMDNGHMYAIARTSAPIMPVEAALVVSDDEGDSWKSVSNDEALLEMLLRCQALLPGTTDQELTIGCDTTDGKIYSFDLSSQAFTLRRTPAEF